MYFSMLHASAAQLSIPLTVTVCRSRASRVYSERSSHGYVRGWWADSR